MAYTYDPSNMNQSSDVASMMKAYPYIRKVSLDEFNKLPAMYDKICSVKNSDLSAERENTTGMGGVWSSLAEKAEYTYSNIDEGTEVTYTHTTYADAVDLSYEMVQDNQWKKAFNGAKLLGRGGYAAREDVAATVYNNAFTSGNGTDGGVLCSSSHNLINSSSTGDNSITDILDASGLAAAFALGRRVVNEANLYIPIMYDTLLVPPELEEIAIQLVVNEAKPGTANRDVNVFSRSLADNGSNYSSRIKRIIVNPYLDSTVAWFLIASAEEAKAKMYIRQDITFELERDVHTRAFLHQGRMRLSAGHTDWQAVIGSTGTGA